MLHRKFEKRTWKKDESFSDYVYQKVILRNRMSVVEEKLVEYIIDGIPDRTLRNQVQVGGFRTIALLIRLFEQVELWDKEYTETKSGGQKLRSKRGNEAGKSEQKKRNHFSKDCPTKMQGPKCFKCNKHGHIALKCVEQLTQNRAP
jgi:hypothetical protein